MSDKFSPTSNFSQAHLVGGAASNDIDNQLLLRLDPTTKRLLVATTTDIAQSEDAVHSSGDTGVMMLAVRQDTQADFAADGDYVPLSIDGNGALRVAGGGGGTEYTEGDTDATITGTALMWEDTSDTLRAVSAAKPLPAELKAGTASIGTLGANSGVDIGDVDVTSIIPGVAATNLGKAEDAVHASGDTGVMALAVRSDTLAALAADGDYVPLQVNNVGALWTEIAPSVIDSGNSSTATLAGGAVFTGAGVEVLDYQTVTIQIDSSHNSATDGMTFQFSTDNSNWDDVYKFTYTAANDARRFQFPTTARYFRVVYTNGGTNQTTFRLQTILHHGNTLTTIHRLGDDISKDRSAQIMKSAIIAQRAGTGDFIAVQATAGGNLKISMQEISDGLDIGAGNAGAETQRVSISTDDVNLVAIKNAVEIMDDWDETNRAAVNLIASQVGVAGGAGTVGATVQRMTLASDDPAVALLGTIDTDTGVIAGAVASGQMQVDIVAALPAGSNAIGKLAANSGVDIGDVDVTSLPASIDGPGAPSIDSYTQVAINLNAGANQVLVSSAPNKQIWVYGIVYTCSVAGTVSFQDELDVAITGIMDHAANSGLSHPASGNFAMPIWKLGTDKDLEVDVVTADIDGWLDYAIVSV